MKSAPFSYFPTRALVAAAIFSGLISSGFAKQTGDGKKSTHPAPSAPAVPASERKVITLEQAYDLALATDQSVRTAYIEIRKANLLPWSALTKLTPRINGGFGYTYNEQRVGSTFGTANFLSTSNSENTDLALQQTLVDFTFFPAYRLAKLTGASARLQYQFSLRTVLFGVAKAYYEVLKEQKIVELDSNTVDLAENQLKLSQNQFDAGAVSKVDVLRAQSTLETARQQLITDQNILALNRDTLANTLNLQGAARSFDVAQPGDATEADRSFDQFLTEAYLNREDYRVGSIAIQQNIEQKNEVIGQYAPTVSAQVSKNWAAQSDSPHSDSWGATVSVNVPFFTGGQREIDLRTASHNIEEAKLSLETTAKNVESDVKTTWLEVQTLRETIKSLKTQVAANEQNYKDLLNQYEAGAATSLDTQSALIQLFTSRTNLITQSYQYQVALRDLERSISAFQNKRVKGVRLPVSVFEPSPIIPSNPAPISP